MGNRQYEHFNKVYACHSDSLAGGSCTLNVGSSSTFFVESLDSKVLASLVTLSIFHLNYLTDIFLKQIGKVIDEQLSEQGTLYIFLCVALYSSASSLLLANVCII